jgi:hypothetical protein
MATLRQAVDLGYRDAQHIATDTDLATLRPRRDFQLLLLDAALPPEPFKR